MARKPSEKRMLGIVGSPRPGGNTEILVDEILRGAEDAGIHTEKVLLRDLVIGPCRGCDACGKTGKCVQRDGMPGLLEKMQNCGVWVLGTPVYYWGPTAQFKAFVDRWYGAGKIVDWKTKAAILAIPLGSTSAEDARHAEGMLLDSLAHQGTRVLATVIALGVFDKAAIRGKTAVLEEARRAGRKAAAGVRS
jgi:multimeric flavodoxin WrbA